MSNVTTNTGTSSLQVLQYYLFVRYDFHYNDYTHGLEIRDKSDVENKNRYIKSFDLDTILKNVRLIGIPCSKATLKMLLYSIYFKQVDQGLDYMVILRELDDVNYIQDFGDITRDFWTFCLRKWIEEMVASHVNDDYENQMVINLSWGGQKIGKRGDYNSLK